jgi:hypothetical protein
VGPTLVGDGNYSCERVVGGEAESPRVRRRLVERDGDFSCGTETGRARQRLVERDGNSSCGAETSRARRRLVVEATYQSEVRCLASEGLDEDLCRVK